MNKSQRIRTTLDGTDKYVQVKLEQNVEFLEILSLKIDQEQAYQNFNSDYGVLVGRVIANGGVGIPNAKISIFIPLSDDDELDAKIKAIYPYKSPQDKNTEGKRYNLLPRVSTLRSDGAYKPKQPFGTFPPKEEILTNETHLEVYEKYYKFTTVTNNSGDYMIFGIPVGIQTVHMSVDITDIGEYSMTPAAMVVNLGYSPNLFIDNNTKIKSSTDLSDLPNVETQEISVDVRPFWGDDSTYEIGITRQDFRIRAVLVNTFTIFGASFTDGEESAWTKGYKGTTQIEEFYRIQDDGDINTSMASKRITDKLIENIFYYPNDVSDDDITTGNVDTTDDISLLTKSEYSRFVEDGQFVFIINCNRKKIITSESGDQIVVSNDDANGIFTEFKGFMTLEYDDNDIEKVAINLDSGDDSLIDGRNPKPIRNKYKIPQSATINNTFSLSEDSNTENWRKQYHTFKGGKIYSVSKFHSLEWVSDDSNRALEDLSKERYNNVAIIMTGNISGIQNTIYDFPSNGTSGGFAAFGSQWMNFCIHFVQQGWVNRGGTQTKTNDTWTINPNSFHFLNANQQKIASYVRNTKGFARSDRNQTRFIEVPREDIVAIWNQIPNEKGFKSVDVINLTIDNYMNGSVNGLGGKINGIPANPIDNNKYFYRGFNSADCIEYLIRLGIV